MSTDPTGGRDSAGRIKRKSRAKSQAKSRAKSQAKSKLSLVAENDHSARAGRDRRYHLVDRRKVVNAWCYFVAVERRSGGRRCLAERRQAA